MGLWRPYPCTVKIGVLAHMFQNSTLGCYRGFHGNLDIRCLQQISIMTINFWNLSNLEIAFSESGNCMPISRLHKMYAQSQHCVAQVWKNWNGSLVPRPSHPALVTCSTKWQINGGVRRSGNEATGMITWWVLGLSSGRFLRLVKSRRPIAAVKEIITVLTALYGKFRHMHKRQLTTAWSESLWVFPHR